MSWLNGKGVAPKLFKEGKGVDKNEPEKKGFFKFWDVVWAKLGKFIQANALYTGLSLLWLVFLYMVLPIRQDWLMTMVSGEGAEYAANTLAFGIREIFTLVMFNLWGNALVAPSYAFVARCFTRGEPVWVWSDGLDVFKQNFKQALALFIIDAVVILMSVNAAIFYYVQYTSTNSYMWLFMCGLFCAVFFVYTIMHYYIYQIMITFDCTLMQLFKNSVLCAIANLPMSVLLTVISIGIIVGLSFAVYPGIVIVFDLIAGLCVTRFPMEFYASRVIGNMIKQQEKQINRNKAKITYVGEDK